ncbi:MAG: hypothetical protein AB7V13_10885, partial [Pseudorhodoplanes sp.]
MREQILDIHALLGSRQTARAEEICRNRPDMGKNRLSTLRKAEHADLNFFRRAFIYPAAPFGARSFIEPSQCRVPPRGATPWRSNMALAINDTAPDFEAETT